MADDFWYDEEAAQRAVDYFSQCLVHVKGKQWAGEPFTLLPWQEEEIVRPLFGWKRQDGTRKYRTCYIEVPRKNGKSTLGAGMGLYLAGSDDEEGAEVYSAAAERKQAGIIHDIAKEMRRRSPFLTRVSKSFRSRIVFPASASYYECLSAEAGTKYGLNAHGVVFDELHAQTNRLLYDVLRTSLAARLQPLFIMITTAGWDRSSICYEVHEYAKKVRDGIVEDDTFLPVIYAADQEDDWKDPEVWKKANPSYGITVTEAALREACHRATESPAEENTFKRLHLNIWTEQYVRWIQMDRWDAGSEPIEVEELKGQLCYAGLDLASTTDIAALSLVFPGENSQVKAIFDLWVPEERCNPRSHALGSQYATWADLGHLKTTPGNVIDYEYIRARVNELGKVFKIKELAIDRWNATQITIQLEQDGFTVVPYGQGYQDMTSPTKELETLLLANRLRHGGHPVVRWMASNVSVAMDAAGNLKPHKGASGGKIDGIVALIMGLGRLIRHTGGGGSVYKRRGIRVIDWDD